MLRPALPWAKGSRVPASASGVKRVWFRRFHHPRRRCAPCLVPRRQAAQNRGTSQTLTSQGKGCSWYQPARWALRVPLWYQMVWDHPFPLITTAVVTSIRR